MGKRYIDADEFVKRVIQYPRQSTKTIGLALADTPTADVVEKERYDILLEHANILAEAVRKYQTADVPERNVGKWIWQGSIFEGCWVCSECNHRFYQGYGNENFCPNCGADCRGGKDE